MSDAEKKEQGTKGAKGLLRSVVEVGVISYVLLGGLLFVMQDSILYQSRNDSVATGFEDSAITITAEDGVTLHGWLIRTEPPADSTIVYYGGNAEVMAYAIKPLLPFGRFNYLLMDYRGYGGSEGQPNEQDLKHDAVTILQTLSGEIDLHRTHLVGRSLGTAIAIHVAAEMRVASLTLISPFDSIESVASAHYPIFPVSLLLRHKFRAIDDAARVTEPTLILKAASDRIIPHRNTDTLIAAWQGPLETVTLPDTEHNWMNTAKFYEVITTFINLH